MPEDTWSTDDADGDNTADDFALTLPVEIFVNINANAGTGATVVGDGGETLTGSTSYSTIFTENTAMFTVVEELDPIPIMTDTTPPTVVSIMGEPNTAGDKAVFTITFSEALAMTGAGALTATDFDIANGTADDEPTTTDYTVYTLTVTPDDPKLPVTVMLEANAVDDAAGLSNTAASAVSSVTVQEDGDGPTVDIDLNFAYFDPNYGPNSSPVNADGEVEFRLAFNEPLAKSGAAALSLGDINITNGADDAELSAPTIDSDGGEVYILTVSPDGTGRPLTVRLNTDSVEDEYGNVVVLSGAGADNFARFDMTPPTLEDHSFTVNPDDDDQLIVELVFNEWVQIDTIDIDEHNGSGVTQAGDAEGVGGEFYTYTVTVEAEGHADRATTEMVLEAGLSDTSGNAIDADIVLTYESPTATVPTVAISASPDPINCETGSTITFAITGTTETLVIGDITVGAGWKVGTDNDPSDGTIDIVPDGNAAIGVTTVSVSVKANAVGSNAAKSEPFTVGPVLTIPANSYIVVIRPEHSGSTHLNDPLYLGSLGVAGVPVNIQYWECMPDLTVFFGKSGAGLGGGALVVKESPDNNSTTNPVVKGTVGISEIMWASDEGTIHGLTSNTMQAREQWIELHNINPHEVKVTLFARLTTQALNTNRADEIDRASNFEVGNTWVVKGQSGNSALGIDFVSMFRSKNAQNYAHNDNNGKNAGKWHVSTLTYRTRGALLASSGQLAQENLTYDFKGTPGRSNTISAANPPLRTDVKNTPIIFNEVANRRDQTLEWIELKNVSDSAKDLRNYEISLVTGVNSETRLYVFPNVDNQVIIQPGELLLLVDTDMRYNDNHPVAVGYNVRGGNDQGLAVGDDSPRYVVTDFAEGGLPDNGEFLLILRTSKPDEGYENKKGTRDRVSDVIGYHSNLKATGHPLYTNLWPFSVYGTARARNKIEVETVHYRRVVNDPDQGDNAKPEQIALNNAGYTGIGYKRHAQESVAHGGTPGYEDIRKNLVAEVSGTGRVTISEIMFDQGDGRYPQWIELY